MHEYLEKLEHAIRHDRSLRNQLHSHTSSPQDLGAGIVTALLYPGQARLGVNGTTFDASERGDVRAIRSAAEHFAERIRGESLLENIGYAHLFLGRRPTCTVPLATELTGWIAANHPENIKERTKLYGTRPGEESLEFAVELDERSPKLKAHIGIAYVDGEQIHRKDFLMGGNGALLSKPAGTNGHYRALRNGARRS